MKMMEMIDLRDYDALLDEYEVEVMLYDAQLDAQWVQTFRKNPAWVIDSEDEAAVLFTRIQLTSPN